MSLFQYVLVLVLRGVRLRSLALARQWWRDAAEEDPGDQEADPDNETEQAEQIDRGEFAKPFLPERLEIRQHADGEESQNEEDDAKRVGLADRRRHLLGDVGRRAERKIKSDGERDHEADDEFREALPDFQGACLVLIARDVDVVGPDVAEHERPDADKDVDEDLDGRGGAENP